MQLRKILLIEDDPDVVLALTDYLTAEGYQPDSASGQKMALDKLQDEHFDLVLLDISLSDGNGFAVCSAIKQQGDIPVIFLTAMDSVCLLCELERIWNRNSSNGSNHSGRNDIFHANS